MTKGIKNKNSTTTELCMTHLNQFIVEKVLTDFSKVQFFDMERKPNKNWANNCDHKDCRNISNFRVHLDLIV